MVGIQRIDNLDIVCADVDAMVDFFHGTLGFPFRLPYERGQGWAAVEAGNVTVFLLRGNDDPPSPPRPPKKADAPPGLDSLGFAVEDLDAAIAELEGKVEWAAAIEVWENPTGTWYRFRKFYDPSGNLMSVTEPHKTAWHSER